MSRRITENSGRHITVRQLESTVRLAQGKLQTYSSKIYVFLLAHAKLIFSKEVRILDAIVAVLLMEASLNGCGKLLDKMNALHTTFAQQPETEYRGHGIHNRIIHLNGIYYFYLHFS
jgi:DNA replicative helicase MCM subunit Mcm2 (Cdc46/Mcm family)